MFNFNIDDNPEQIHIDLSNLDQFSDTNSSEEIPVENNENSDFLSIEINETESSFETETESSFETEPNTTTDNDNTFNGLYQSLLTRITEIRNNIENSLTELENINDNRDWNIENNNSIENTPNIWDSRLIQPIPIQAIPNQTPRLDWGNWDIELETIIQESENVDIEAGLNTENELTDYYHQNKYQILINSGEKILYRQANKFSYQKFNYINFLKRRRPEINKKITEIVCSSCYSDYRDKKIILQKINNIDNLNENTLFATPCGEHFICYECLKKIALSFENHLINRNNSLIYCIAEGCKTSANIPFYFDHKQIKKVLSDKEYQQYLDYAEIYEFPGFETIKCPNMISDYRSSYKCNTRNIIPIDKIKEAEPGSLIIHCIQNRKCNCSFCYHCKQKIYNYQTKCDICFDNNEYNNPFGINRFLVKTKVEDSELELDPETENQDNQDYKIVKRKILEETDYLYRNNQITVDMALDYIKEIIKSDHNANRFQIQCPYCLNFFFKSEKCSALKHCGIERCYSCGKIQERNQRDLNDHWSANGINGCPRFDNEPYWNSYAQCNFRCQDEICYSHEIGECQIEEHQEGIKNMIIERKKAFIYHFLKSLLKEIRQKVLEQLEEDIYENLSRSFLEKVFVFLESNPKYIKYYSPIVFIKELEDFNNK